MFQFFRPIYFQMLIFWRYLQRRRGYLLRFFLCWFVAVITLSNDEMGQLDQRFNLRGKIPGSKNIVQILIKKTDLHPSRPNNTLYPIDTGDYSDINDAYFWDLPLWGRLLSKLLKYNPKKIGVLFYFGDNLGDIDLPVEYKNLFINEKTFWSSSLNLSEQIKTPVFTSRNNKNIGLTELYRDNDGSVRRFLRSKNKVPHLIEKLADKSKDFVINYQGAEKTFKKIYLSELLYDDVPELVLKDKIILIGTEDLPFAQFPTPMGQMNRIDIFSNIIDNLIENRTPLRFSNWVYYFFFLILNLLTVYIIARYPQSVALFLILFLGVMITALSAWLFDTYAIWSPVFSSLVLIASTWVVFIGHQATRIERKNYELQQEQKYLQELEILKNNFVSLISHDLKTPIAKIHAVIERLLTQNHPTELYNDLMSLQKYNEELNKYIQSILKVLRVESRDFKLHMEVADINDTINQVVQKMLPLADEKKIRITSNLEPLFTIEYDLTLIAEVIQNLIENAIKYSKLGGNLKITSKEINNYIYVDVIDEGEGILPEDLPKIWRKFTRGTDQDLKTKGSGLGLYLVKYFIELHGGQVKIESEVGKGTHVTFSLPVTEETANGHT